MSSALARPVGPFLDRRKSGHRYIRVPEPEQAPKASKNGANQSSSPPSIFDLARNLYGINEVKAWFPHLTSEMETEAGGDVVMLVALAFSHEGSEDLGAACEWFQERLYIDHLGEIEDAHSAARGPKAKSLNQSSAHVPPSGGRQRLRQRSEYRAWELDEFDIPQRHSRPVYKLGLISERYRWLWSLTVKGYEIDTPEECDRTQKRLKQLLRDAYKRWGIRFLLKREFDLERGRHWPHWHIYSPDPLPEEVEAYLRQGVLWMHRAKNNKRQIYKFRRNRTPKQQASCGWYAGKVDKTPEGGGARPINTFYPPKGWSRKLKCRAYALIGLSGEGPASSGE